MTLHHLIIMAAICMGLTELADYLWRYRRIRVLEQHVFNLQRKLWARDWVLGLVFDVAKRHVKEPYAATQLERLERRLKAELPREEVN